MSITDNSMYGFVYDAVTDWEKTKLNYYGRKFSAKELFALIDRLSVYLAGAGVKKGDSVGICMPNLPEGVIAFYAVNKLGAIANIIHPRIGIDNLADILKKTDTKVLFAFDRYVARYHRRLAKQKVSVIACSQSYFAADKHKTLTFIEPKVFSKNIIPFYKTLSKSGKTESVGEGKDAAVYLHSSGTTGIPKTVVLSNLAFNELVKNTLDAVNSKFYIGDDYKMLMVLPFFHGFGLGICMHLPLYRMQMVMLPYFRAGSVASLIGNEPVELMAGVPSMFAKLLLNKKFLRSDLSGIKIMFAGGDKVDEGILHKFNGLMAEKGGDGALIEGYGLSETASVASINMDGTENCQGSPLPNINFRIMNGEKECQADEEGELLINTPSLMNGYLEGDLGNVVIYNGVKWLRTGDVGYLDAEGRFFYRDRLKRMIKIGGVNIFPGEVEQIIESIDGIKQACVVRRTDNGKPCTEAVCVTDKGVRLGSLIPKIEKTVSDRLYRYAVPKIFTQVKKLPLNSIGKVDFCALEQNEHLQRGNNVLK